MWKRQTKRHTLVAGLLAIPLAVTLISSIGQSRQISEGRTLLDQVISKSDVELGIVVDRKTERGNLGLIPNRLVVRDQIWFATDEEEKKLTAWLTQVTKANGKWDRQWIRWSVYRNVGSNGSGRPDAPLDFNSLVYISVDINVSKISLGDLASD